jgi:hypothetical protein
MKLVISVLKERTMIEREFEPLPPQPRLHELSLDDWYREVELYGGWDNDEVEIVAEIVKNSTWDTGQPMRLVGVTIQVKNGLAVPDMIASYHQYDEGSRV